MREIYLVKQINNSYKKLGLKYSKVVTALFLMGLTAVLEMVGLSLLYPVMLLMVGHSKQQAFFAWLPYSHQTQIFIVFGSVSLLYILKNIALYFSYSYNIDFAKYYYRNLVRGLYEVYIHKPLLEFRKESAGSLANIICVQSGKLVDGIVRPLLVVTTESLILLAISVLVFLISPILIVALVLVCGAAASIYYLSFRTKALAWGKTSMEALSNLQELVNNTALGIMEIKIFGKEKYLTSKVYAASVVETNMFHNLEMHQQAPRFIIETVFTITILSFLLFSFLSGQDSSGLLAKFSVFAAAAFRILPSINRLVGSYSNFSFNVGPGLTLMKTISELNLNSDEIEVQQNYRTQESSIYSSANKIEVQDLSFQYTCESLSLILNKVNMTLIKGQKVGIVGASGSGKSTFIKLLAGLQIPNAGSITVDQKNIFHHLKDWQKNIGYVPQESFIMPGSIKENICFGLSEKREDSEIWQVLETVGLANFVRNLPLQLETSIGEKGVLLSGGQKQLICLSRALFRKPLLLLLDEPTASLDIYNEQLVLQAIFSLPAETTIVMVSHKLENFRAFDILYCCENGHLIKQEYQKTEKQKILKVGENI